MFKKCAILFCILVAGFLWLRWRSAKSEKWVSTTSFEEILKGYLTTNINNELATMGEVSINTACPGSTLRKLLFHVGSTCNTPLYAYSNKCMFKIPIPYLDICGCYIAAQGGFSSFTGFDGMRVSGLENTTLSINYKTQVVHIVTDITYSVTVGVNVSALFMIPPCASGDTVLRAAASCNTSDLECLKTQATKAGRNAYMTVVQTPLPNETTEQLQIRANEALSVASKQVINTYVPPAQTKGLLQTQVGGCDWYDVACLAEVIAEEILAAWNAFLAAVMSRVEGLINGVDLIWDGVEWIARGGGWAGIDDYFLINVPMTVSGRATFECPLAPVLTLTKLSMANMSPELHLGAKDIYNAYQRVFSSQVQNISKILSPTSIMESIIESSFKAVLVAIAPDIDLFFVDKLAESFTSLKLNDLLQPIVKPLLESLTIANPVQPLDPSYFLPTLVFSKGMFLGDFVLGDIDGVFAFDSTNAPNQTCFSPLMDTMALVCSAIFDTSPSSGTDLAWGLFDQVTRLIWVGQWAIFSPLRAAGEVGYKLIFYLPNSANAVTLQQTPTGNSFGLSTDIITADLFSVYDSGLVYSSITLGSYIIKPMKSSLVISKVASKLNAVVISAQEIFYEVIHFCDDYGLSSSPISSDCATEVWFNSCNLTRGVQQGVQTFGNYQKSVASSGVACALPLTSRTPVESQIIPTGIFDQVQGTYRDGVGSLIDYSQGNEMTVYSPVAVSGNLYSVFVSFPPGTTITTVLVVPYLPALEDHFEKPPSLWTSEDTATALGILHRNDPEYPVNELAPLANSVLSQMLHSDADNLLLRQGTTNSSTITSLMSINVPLNLTTSYSLSPPFTNEVGKSLGNANLLQFWFVKKVGPLQLHKLKFFGYTKECLSGYVEQGGVCVTASPLHSGRVCPPGSIDPEFLPSKCVLPDFASHPLLPTNIPYVNCSGAETVELTFYPNPPGAITYYNVCTTGPTSSTCEIPGYTPTTNSRGYSSCQGPMLEKTD